MNDNNYYLKKSKAVLREVRKSVIGKDDVICKVYMAIIAGGHVLLDDIPGVGKTTMAHAFANALGLGYNTVYTRCNAIRHNRIFNVQQTDREI